MARGHDRRRPKGSGADHALLLSHTVMNGRRLAGAMILDRLDAEERATALQEVGYYSLPRPAKS